MNDEEKAALIREMARLIYDWEESDELAEKLAERILALVAECAGEDVGGGG